MIDSYYRVLVYVFSIKRYIYFYFLVVMLIGGWDGKFIWLWECFFVNFR